MKKLIILALLAVGLGSCVTMKSYNTMKAQAIRMEWERDEAVSRQDALVERSNIVLEEKRQSEQEKDELKKENDILAKELQLQKSDLLTLNDKHVDLENKYHQLLSDGSAEASRVLRELEQKEAQLERSKADLVERERRVEELKDLLNAREEAINAIRNQVSIALDGFEGKGINISMKDGRVLVSMEDKLLFKSGSFEIDTEGARAVRDLGVVLAHNKDINILVEGHTDNVPYRPNQYLKDNLDLSAKRATTVVRLLLENTGIDPERVLAAGRGESTPVDRADTAAARAKNRRTEIYLTPKLDELFQMLADQDY